MWPNGHKLCMCQAPLCHTSGPARDPLFPRLAIPSSPTSPASSVPRAVFSGQLFFLFFPCQKMSTSSRRRFPPKRRQLLHNGRRLPSNCRRLSNRRWLPFTSRPTVCLNTDLTAGQPKLFSSVPPILG